MSVALCWLAAAIWLSAGRRLGARRRFMPRWIGSHVAPATMSHEDQSAGNSTSSATGEKAPARGSGQAWHRRIRSPAFLSWFASGAVVVASIAALGPSRGAVLGTMAVPATWWLLRRAHAQDAARVSAGALRRVPLVLDLLAAALRAGQPVASALATVAPLAGAYLAPQLRQIAGLLRFGAEPAIAWASFTESPLAPVAHTACRSAESGVRMARGFELLAAELRDESRSAAVARAHRAGVWAMAPLGLCFLPAFACLGVLPVIVGIARGVLSGTVP